MILSHQLKYIFIKPEKVAGTSVQNSLIQYCSDPDRFPTDGLRRLCFLKSEDLNENSNDVKRFKVDSPDECADLKCGTHINSRRLQKILNPEIWKTYFKFTIVRNPWDQAVSRYHHEMLKWVDNGKSKDDFSDFPEWLVNDKQNNEPYYFNKQGHPLVDYYIRFETLQDDYNKVCRRIGIPKNTLRKLKVNIRTAIQKKYKHYSQYYTQDTKEFIFKNRRQTIEYFHYKFEE